MIIICVVGTWRIQEFNYVRWNSISNWQSTTYSKKKTENIFTIIFPRNLRYFFHRLPSFHFSSVASIITSLWIFHFFSYQKFHLASLSSFSSLPAQFDLSSRPRKTIFMSLLTLTTTWTESRNEWRAERGKFSVRQVESMKKGEEVLCAECWVLWKH